MTVVKIPLVNASPQVSADVCKGDSLVRCGRRERARGGAKMALSVAFFMYEPVSHNLSWNLSLKNAKP